MGCAHSAFVPYLDNTRSCDGNLHQSQTLTQYYVTDNHTRILEYKMLERDQIGDQIIS
ncbi:hypothetical protein C0J52_24377 [Blattella germanica]|nr:hypothetical protein C0J52_24377 [Blattella germanica]